MAVPTFTLHRYFIWATACGPTSIRYFQPEPQPQAWNAGVIHGDRDISAPLDFTGRRTADLIPGSQLKVYEGDPHGLFITHMKSLNRELLDAKG